MKKIVLGVLAHVDAGKTTLTEAILYKTGKLRSLGRVDHKTAYLDNNRMERDRGITIFSKQATFCMDGADFYLQDTPGHVDFSAEMERTLSVLDYAVLVVSAPDGIQSHTATLIDLLKKNSIPYFVFINKTDLLYDDLKLPDNWINFSKLDEESLALCSDDAMIEYEATGNICDDTISSMIDDCSIVPCFYGSALKLDGIDELLSAISKYTKEKNYPKEFGARCFKITRDSQGQRLSWLKITGGRLCVKDIVGEEKVSQIRIYSADKFEAVDCVYPGSICAVCGFEASYAGEGFGFEEDITQSSLEPVLTYSLRILDGTDTNSALKKLSVLAEEDPMLGINWDENIGEIQIQLMGEVQIDVLKTQIFERLGMEVSVEKGRVLYKETISSAVEGVGHFEPLRHYAEVHLLMEPLSPGTGLVLETACSEDVLDRNWQRLILHNLSEYRHKGVLTGSPLTDVKITLVAGRSHLKHTEGGDFRQASLRAVRQGLMKTENVLLEPFYRFKIELPPEYIGHAISDLRAAGAILEAPDSSGDMSIISGLAPVIEMNSYQTNLLSYTKGKGRISLRYAGYYPCHNTAEVLDIYGYDPDRDTQNPSSSVFCSHGSGTFVSWDKVDDFAHIDGGISIENGVVSEALPKLRPSNFDFDERELEEIMKREFGTIKRPKYSTVVYEPINGYKSSAIKLKQEYLIVDGYNMIFAWEVFKKLRDNELDAARTVLADILCEYASVKGCELVLVFDGYKLRGNCGTKEEYKGINIVYTKEAQSADAYIEKLVADLGHSYNVGVATSDAMIQLTALRQGTRRISAAELEHDIRQQKLEIEKIIRAARPASNKLADSAKILKKEKNR